MELFRKRSADYSDFAYREAVSKLKYLLAESYTPISVHKFSPDGPIYKIPYTTSFERLSSPDVYPVPIKRSVSTTPKKRSEYESSSNEFGNYLKKQEGYIQQLEKESLTYKAEVEKLLSKVRDVIEENERLRKGEKIINGSTNETEEESELEEKEGRKRYCKHHHYSGSNIVYESRISELEAQLTQCRMELRKAQEDAIKGLSKPIEPTIYTVHDTNKQIEALQRERDELNETIRSLQSLVGQLRDKEASATLKVKRSLDLVDQSHFDKNQLEMEVRRLKNELERMNDKQRESLQETARRVNEAEKRYAMQIERLNGDLAAQWDTANRLNLELDRARRTEQELRRDLATKNSVIEELKKELTTKTSNLQTEALTAGAERETLESELSTVRLAVERSERAGRQEAARLQAEVASLRQRLDRADADLMHSRKENLRLSDTVSSLEKELDLAKMKKDTNKSKDYSKNEDLAAMIKDLDSKHAQSVAELEGMVQSQNQLMEKLKNECQMLTERLEDSTARHKEEMAGLQSNVEYLNSKLDAPVNYENQEWRGDDMVNNYQNDGQRYEGTDEQGGQNAQPVTAHQNGKYEGQESAYHGQEYNQEGPYQGNEAYDTTGYETQAQYDDQSGYTAQEDPSYTQENQGYPQDPNTYQQNQDYPQDPDAYQQNDKYPQDPNAYPPDSYSQDSAYAHDPNYPPDTYPDQTYPQEEYPEGSSYPQEEYPEGSSYPPEDYPRNYPPDSQPDPNQQQPSNIEADQPDTTVLSGVDATGTSILAQQEEYIPQPLQ